LVLEEEGVDVDKEVIIVLLGCSIFEEDIDDKGIEDIDMEESSKLETFIIVEIEVESGTVDEKIFEDFISVENEGEVGIVDFVIVVIIVVGIVVFVTVVIKVVGIVVFETVVIIVVGIVVFVAVVCIDVLGEVLSIVVFTNHHYKYVYEVLDNILDCPYLSNRQRTRIMNIKRKIENKQNRIK
jgi:hypothetical protein